MKPGHFLLQPYFDAFTNVGFYNSHWKSHSSPNFYNIDTRLIFRAGILKWLDGQITPQVSYKQTQGKHSVGFNDLPVALNIQLLAYDTLDDPWPAIRLVLKTWIPCGKYQKLNPSLKFTDAMGTGSWYPEIGIASSRFFYLSGIHYVDLRFYAAYRLGTPTSVKGLNVYGGDSSTHGTAYPGNLIIVDAAIQYNFSQSIAFACDINYTHENRSRFSGYTTEAATLPSSEQFSVAPALEYNWSKELGLIGGVWFSVAGRNNPQFINGMLSLNAYF